MIDLEWQTSEDARRMLGVIREHFGPRKWRLYAVACWRRLGNEAFTPLLEINELAADEPDHPAVKAAAPGTVIRSGHEASEHPALRLEGPPEKVAAELSARAKLLREIFGNPFRPLKFNSRDLPAAIQTQAEQIYAESRFEALPALADALAAAGVHEPSLLAHLRSPGPHVKGCWALDLVQGKG